MPRRFADADAPEVWLSTIVKLRCIPQQLDFGKPSWDVVYPGYCFFFLYIFLLSSLFFLPNGNRMPNSYVVLSPLPVRGKHFTCLQIMLLLCQHVCTRECVASCVANYFSLVRLSLYGCEGFFQSLQSRCFNSHHVSLKSLISCNLSAGYDNKR